MLLDEWSKCVRQAKKKLGVPTDSFVMVTGKLIKEARYSYCAKLYIQTKKNKNLSRY
jgi:hypothetical protein